MSNPEATPAKPWASEPAAIAEQLRVDTTRGLEAADAKARSEQHGMNELAAAVPEPRWRKLLREFRDPLIYLLLGSVAVSFVAWLVEGAHGLPIEAIVILLIVLANALLGYAQGNRAERAVAALQRLTETSTSVLRDGLTTRIPSREVVPGDILVLNEGDAVAADARLLSCTNLKVIEASLTGESEPALKHTHVLTADTGLADRVNMVYKGTAVASGVGRAVVVRTGPGTEVGQIARLLDQTKEEASPLEREIQRVGKTLGLGVLAVAAIVVLAVLWADPPSSLHEVIEVLLLGVSLAVAAVPEGLPAVLSVVLAIGVQRMAKQRAVVKKLSSVETLGSTSIICSDKTGTLTCNEMTVQRVVTHAGTANIGGIGYTPEGSLTTEDGAAPSGEMEAELGLLLRHAALANNAELNQNGKEWVIQGDPTEAALIVAKLKWIDRPEQLTRVAEIPFTSERKLMSVIVEDGDRAVLITKGAPDVLLELSTSEQVGEVAKPIPDERRKAIQAEVDALSDLALRPLAVAHRTLTSEEREHSKSSDGADLPSTLERDLVYVGLVGMLDPPRAEARVAIQEAKGAGIRTMMITGDHPRTAARIAEQLGLDTRQAVVTGQELAALSPDALHEKVHSTSVFARVAPEHKLRIVAALQKRGEIVAMTGDGVNDAPALKAANIGIAMGITGTDVSKEAAKMILADDNFATIVAAVREGRLIFHNITAFLRYLLSSNTGEVLTVFFGVIGATWLGLVLPDGTHVSPLLATQILWINLLTDAAPALALGIDRATSDLMARPPRPSRSPIIDRGMVTSVLYSGAIMAACTLFTLDAFLPGGFVEGNRSVPEARSAAFTVLVLAQLFNCLNSRSHATSAFAGLFTNPWLWAALAASFGLQILVIHHPWLNHAFKTTPLSFGDWAMCWLMASAVLWGGELRKLFVRVRAAPEPSYAS